MQYAGRQQGSRSGQYSQPGDADLSPRPVARWPNHVHVEDRAGYEHSDYGNQGSDHRGRRTTGPKPNRVDRRRRTINGVDSIERISLDTVGVVAAAWICHRKPLPPQLQLLQSSLLSTAFCSSALSASSRLLSNSKDASLQGVVNWPGPCQLLLS